MTSNDWEYKRVSDIVPFCPKCKKRIKGNGSTVLPYTCKCGEWEFDDGCYKLK